MRRISRRGGSGRPLGWRSNAGCPSARHDGQPQGPPHRSTPPLPLREVPSPFLKRTYLCKAMAIPFLRDPSPQARRAATRASAPLHTAPAPTRGSVSLVRPRPSLSYAIRLLKPIEKSRYDLYFFSITSQSRSPACHCGHRSGRYRRRGWCRRGWRELCGSRPLSG